MTGLSKTFAKGDLVWARLFPLFCKSSSWSLPFPFFERNSSTKKESAEAFRGQEQCSDHNFWSWSVKMLSSQPSLVSEGVLILAINTYQHALTYTERCKFVRAVCQAPAWRGRLWLAAAGQKLSLNLARTNLHLSVCGCSMMYQVRLCAV